MRIVKNSIALVLLIGTGFSVLAQVNRAEGIRLTQLSKQVTIIDRKSVV